ncbi:hypothetical protein AM493_14960 [Flavobacterium akiainvivens]|uniref:DUF4259 domain-containing protein n=1 Tax=Flavobacterium akiainvivens TaxID=1202724 RepID=A0A0M8MEH9_9FLAO|nr:DUF4259 domain-containing protein [Flavobacterium akiainvivens]KOS07194.1 hypothetical protein AM493_14960 [Flavobacterium akiainvivens]SFQ72746.1 protein of unknown function [Flavobacterium akiainvivens]
MGAWDYGIFDDDTAYEFEDEIKENPLAFFETSVKTAIKPGYLESTEAYAALISAAYIDNLLNGTVYRTDADDQEDEGNVNKFGQLHKTLNVSHIIAPAIKALKKITGKNSELNELWLENKELYPKWKETIESLSKRLENHTPKQNFWQKIFK